jgi:hypothetical protein
VSSVDAMAVFLVRSAVSLNRESVTDTFIVDTIAFCFALRHSSTTDAAETSYTTVSAQGKPIDKFYVPQMQRRPVILTGASIWIRMLIEARRALFIESKKIASSNNYLLG